MRDCHAGLTRMLYVNMTESLIAGSGQPQPGPSLESTVFLDSASNGAKCRWNNEAYVEAGHFHFRLHLKKFYGGRTLKPSYRSHLISTLAGLAYRDAYNAVK